MSIWGYRAAALAIIVTFGSLGTFVYHRNPRSRLHQDCFFFSLFVVLWTLGFFLTMFADFGHNRALFFSRLSHAFGVFIPIVFLKFALSLIGIEKEKENFLKINYVLAALLSAGYLFSPWFIEDVQAKLSFPYYPVAGPLYIVFISYWVFLAGYAHYLLFLDYRQNQGYRRQQIKYFFLGQIIAWGGAFLLFPLIFGIKIDPVTYILLPMYSILTTYAIVRHQLLDIRIVIKRTLLYSITALGISILYVIGVYTVNSIILGAKPGMFMQNADNLLTGTIKTPSFVEAIYKWSGALAFSVNIGLAAFVLSFKSKSATYKRFIILSICIGMWSVGSFLVNVIHDKTLAIFVLRVNYLFGIFVPCVFLDFINSLIGNSKLLKKFVTTGYFISLIISPFIFTGLFISGLNIIEPYHFYITRPAILYYVFFLYFFLDWAIFYIKRYFSLQRK